MKEMKKKSNHSTGGLDFWSVKFFKKIKLITQNIRCNIHYTVYILYTDTEVNRNDNQSYFSHSCESFNLHLSLFSDFFALIVFGFLVFLSHSFGWFYLNRIYFAGDFPLPLGIVFDSIEWKTRFQKKKIKEFSLRFYGKLNSEQVWRDKSDNGHKIVHISLSKGEKRLETIFFASWKSWFRGKMNLKCKT